jgi:hypothetical protein
LSGASGSIDIPGLVEGTTVVTFFATDSSGTVESMITNDSGANTVSSASPTITIQVDKTAPAANCIGPNPPPSGWQATDVAYNCTASDVGSGLANSSQGTFALSTNVAAGTETSNATIALVTISDVAGNATTQGPFGPFEVDKKAPAISTPSLSVANPVFGQSVTATYTCTDGGSGVVLCASSQQSQQISPTSAITVSSAVDTSSVGPHTFTAYAQDQVGNPSSSPLSYIVGQATPTLTWTTPAAISFGTALSATQLNANANVAGSFVYNPPAGTVLGAGSQTLSVTFTPSDTTNYATATTTVQLIVTKATPIVTWATPAAIAFGTPLSATQLNATANVPGTFVYIPAAGTVLNAGTQTLSTTFTPTDTVDYATVTASVMLVVNKAIPTIVWPIPAAIPYGTALSSTQLNATANVPGTFVYTPPAGTVIPAGNQTLSVVFTPTDLVDYTPATAQVTILVTQPAISISPSSVNFGTVASGKVAFQTVTVSNVGNSTLGITNISIATGTGSDSDDFTFTKTCGSSLAPGANCGITVKFNADDSGMRTATLYITDTAPGSPQAVPLTGTVGKKGH